MFSVIIPLYNKQDSIKKTIQSILDQTFSLFEVIVIDDGSTDSSYSIVADMLKSDNRIRLYQKCNGGVSSARNAGIKHAQYDHIAFIDGDDIWERSFLYEQSRLISEFPNAKLWGCGWGIIENQTKSPVIHSDFPIGFKGIVKNYFERKHYTNPLCIISIVVLRSAIFQVGYFDERIHYGEDLDFIFRIINSFPVVLNNLGLSFYNLDAENRVSRIKKPPLQICLPFFLEKFETDTNNKNGFISYLHSFCAGLLLPYYFGNKKERLASRKPLSILKYNQIKIKYTFFYKTPFLLGYILYHLKKYIK